MLKSINYQVTYVYIVFSDTVTGFPEFNLKVNGSVMITANF